VTLQYATETEVLVSINKHYEHSRLIEDIVKVQALASQRRFYTDDAGYALSRQIDTDLIQLGRQANNGAGTNVYATAYSGADGTTAYVAGANTGLGAITDAAIRRTIQRLDDNDVPMDDRYLVLPPSARNTMMGLNRFTEQAYVGEQGQGNTIRNGKIGDVYGVEVYVTPQCDTASGSTACRIGLMFHKDAFILVEQMAVRSQTQYKQEYLADLFTADTLYGVQILRKGDLADVPTSAFALALTA
jgi:N4-gp56 family major capsid protein